MPSWLLILSIESVNGPLWNELKLNFLKFIKELPSKSELGTIARNQINSFILNNTKINSKDISCYLS